MGDHPPTPQQAEAVDRFLAGGSLKIEAGAGTGKTSTLRFLAEAARPRHGQYVAFNKAIVEDAGATMPGNVNCATANSLAFREVGRPFAPRLRGSKRLRSNELARVLGLDPIVLQVPDAGRKVLVPGFLAGLVLRSVRSFCQSADLEPGPQHVPPVKGIDRLELGPDGRVRARRDNHWVVANALVPTVVKAWADLQDPEGRLPYAHDHYLKLWQLSNPVIGTEFILFDEAQDANPVMVDIVARQTHAQLVWVGDTNQQIYAFTGAINALESVPADHTCYLTRSFRFGHHIAAVANRLLADLPTVMALEGNPEIDSTVGPVAEPRCVLTRTNATAVRKVMAAHTQGISVHLVGGGGDVIAFAKAARILQDGGITDHRDLACFATWGEVLEYVDHDEQGDELRLNVKLVEDFGVDAILAALERAVEEHQAEQIVSTAHKAKGLEWPSVALAGDFSDDPDVDELRLLYVAVTRARRDLDITAVGVLDDAPARPPIPEPSLLDQEATP